MPSGTAIKNPAERELRWSTRLLLAIDASGEAEARDIGETVLAGVNIPVLCKPQYAQAGWGWWIVSADLDLSSVPSIEPDEVGTRFSYVAEHLAGAQSWSSRVDDAGQRGRFEWPPSVWEKQPGQDDELGHRSVRAARIEIAVRTD